VRGTRRTQASEHLAILDAIEKLDMVQAAGLMRTHLDGARRGKLKQAEAFTSDT
jgi:DNA-binding GntR family transcriptional regulator